MSAGCNDVTIGRPHHLEDLRASFDERPAVLPRFFHGERKRGWRNTLIWNDDFGHSSKFSYWRGFVEIVFLWYHFGQDLMMYVYCQRTLSHFCYASSCGCMRWNKFDATLLPDEVFQNASMHCDQYKWFLRIQLRLGLKSMSAYVLHMSFRHPTLFCMYICMLCLFGYVWIKDSGSQWLLSPWTELYHLVFLKHWILFGGELLIDVKSKYSSHSFLHISPYLFIQKASSKKVPYVISLEGRSWKSFKFLWLNPGDFFQDSKLIVW